MAFRCALLSILLLAGCGSERDVTVRFEGLVGDEPARCGGAYDGVGTTGTTLTLRDLRFYVHDVRLVTTDGDELELALDQDGTWQEGNVALVDLEDGSSECTMGTSETNDALRGTIPADAEITGLRFVLGVPEDRNHDDVTTAPSPLNLHTMHWSWNGGYKFLRVDGRTTGLDTGFALHLGSTGCMGDGRGNVTGCVQENRVEVELTGFDPDTDVVAVDIAALLAGSDMDTDAGGQTGCQSGFDDPDCEPIFHRLGLPFAGTPPPGEQALFRVAPGD